MQTEEPTVAEDNREIKHQVDMEICQLNERNEQTGHKRDNKIKNNTEMYKRICPIVIKTECTELQDTCDLSDPNSLHEENDLLLHPSQKG
jgi:hypothetical protein